MKKIIMASLILFAVNASAYYPVDVYGTSEDEANKILSYYGKSVSDIIDFLMTNATSNAKETKQFIQMKAKKEALMQEIKSKYNLSFIDFSTMIYQKNNGYYKNYDHFTTIEVVKSDNQRRMRFVSSNDAYNFNRQPHIQNQPKDIIDAMIDYNDLAFEMMRHNEIKFTNKKCPAFHCSIGFHHKKLTPYLKKFNTAAIKEKSLILDTIRKDQHLARRAAAIFFIGTFEQCAGSDFALASLHQ